VADPGSSAISPAEVAMGYEFASRILVVEDDASLARSITSGLLDEGYSVTHAADGDEAQRLLESENWDLVILDWWLPGQDGLAVLEEHRRQGRDTPVLFLTARDAVGDRVAGLDAGADDYFCKPFAYDELLARVRALVRRRKAADELSLGFADVRVDVVSRRAFRGEKPLELTTKELSLLIFFLRHKGEVLSRTRIYGEVWGDVYYFVSNTLDVHIKELRRKLETRGPRLIHTIRGRGYQFGDPPESGEKAP
jgi:two-component system copper resistance phosphate regulon response regulator CusR